MTAHLVALIALVGACCCPLVVSAAHGEWNYGDQTEWAGAFPICKGEKMRQSPIDVVTKKVVFDATKRLEFVDYDQEVEFNLTNTHHTVSLTPIPTYGKPALRVNWVKSENEELPARDADANLYELQEIHFHWGDGVNKGSEHEINGQRAAAEMHMVHYRKGVEKAQLGSVEDSVVVIGVFIESDVVEHNKLEGLVARIETVNGTDTPYRDDNPKNLINLLPENHHSFYTYNGSLTTPPCLEVVTWILMSEPVYMSQERLLELSNMEREKASGDGTEKIMANHRDIQPLLNRPVYASFNTSDSTTLDSNTIGKLIGTEGGTLHDALNEYRERVERLKVTIKEAYRSIDDARKRLMVKLEITRGKL